MSLPGPNPLSPADRKQFFKLFSLITLLFASMAMIAPVLDVLVRQPFGLGTGEIRWFMIVHSLPQLLLVGIFLALWSDRMGKRLPIAAAALFGCGITTAAVPWLTDYGVLIVVRFLDGLLGLTAMGLLITRGVDLVRRSGSAWLMGPLMASIPIGHLAGSLSVPLFEMTGPRWLEALFGATGLAMIAGAVWLVPELRRSEHLARLSPTPTEVLGALGRLPKLWLPFFFGFVDKFTFAAFALLTAPILVDRFGMGAGAASFASLALFGFWISFLILSPFCGRLTDRLGALRLMVFASALYGLMLFVLAIGMEPLLFLAAMALCGLLTAAQVVPNMAMVGEMAGPEERATSVEAFHVTGSLGYIMGFMVVGALGASSYTAAYSVAGGMELLAALTGGVVLLLRRAATKGGVPDSPGPPANLAQTTTKGSTPA